MITPKTSIIRRIMLRLVKEPEFEKGDTIIHRQSTRTGKVIAALGEYRGQHIYLVRFYDEVDRPPGGGRAIAAWDLRRVS